jgi:hypothetical protein
MKNKFFISFSIFAIVVLSLFGSLPHRVSANSASNCNVPLVAGEAVLGGIGLIGWLEDGAGNISRLGSISVNIAGSSFTDTSTLSGYLNGLAPGDYEATVNINDPDNGINCSNTETINIPPPPEDPCTAITFSADNTHLSNNTSTTLRFTLSSTYSWYVTLDNGTTSPVPTAGVGQNGILNTGNLTETHTYHLTCLGPSGPSDPNAQKSVTVIVDPPNIPPGNYADAAFVDQNVPTSMAAGDIQLVSVTMQNIGTTTWNTASYYQLGSQNPQDNPTWGGRIPLISGETVAPGATKTFSFSITAPSTPGTYDFQWRMVHDAVDGGLAPAWFGQFTPNVSIVVAAPQDLAQFASQTINGVTNPSSITLVSGQTYAASVTMKNIGNTTWTQSAGQYALGTQNAQDNSLWAGTGRLYIPAGENIFPGDTKTFNFTITAPTLATMAASSYNQATCSPSNSLPSTCNFQWEMVHSAYGSLPAQWFANPSTNVGVTVSPPAPTVNNVTISSPTVTANGSTQYTITVVGGFIGSGGGTSIVANYARINFTGSGTDTSQGPTERGWLAWSDGNYWPQAKNLMACTGGSGTNRAGVLNSSTNPTTTTDQYINLVSCTTSVSGNTRTTAFVVTFNPVFTTPVTNNLIWGLVSATGAPSNSGYRSFPGFNLNLPSGTLSATGCTVLSGSSTCNIPLTWTTANLSANPTAVTRDNPANTTVSSATSGTNFNNAVNPGTYNYYLYHNSVQLAASGPVSATCASGTSWNGTTCASAMTYGLCSPNHYLCAVGNSTNNVNGTSQYTWDCVGTGSTASCGENKSVGPGGANGVCDQTHYNCLEGNSSNGIDGTTSYTWVCTGASGGNSESCLEDKAGGPVNASCGLGHYSCYSGTSANGVDNGTFWSWDCQGSGGGVSDSCWEFRTGKAPGYIED